jgi:hypothetical protein
VTTPPQQPGQAPYGGQQGPFTQPGQLGQPGPQGAPGQFGQPGPQGAPGQFGQPTAGQAPAFPASGQGPAFPASGQGQAFPPSGQGQAFPAAGQGTGFPQQSSFGPSGNGGGFGPAMPAVAGRAGRVGRAIGKRLLIRLIIIGVVAVVAIVWALIASHSDPGNAAVGDCIANLPQGNTDSAQDASAAKKVDCTDSSAAYKVLGVVPDSTGHDLDSQDSMAKTCQQWPQTTYAFEETKTDQSSDNSSGTVLCLTDVKH